jgi:molybdopterin-guanine dinucleotide biosynthesis protein A
MDKYVPYTTPPLTGIILAGGKNIRMGENKAFIRVQGQRIIDRTAELFHEIFEHVILVTNEPLTYAQLNLEIVADFIPESSSLIGMYTGLFYAAAPYCFVVACDMPFLNRKVIDYMVSLRNGYDVVIPLLDDGYHPIHALYSRRCIPPIEELIRTGNFKITDFFNRVTVREVTEKELRSLDPSMEAVLNINTPEDLERVHHQEKLRSRDHP